MWLDQHPYLFIYLLGSATVLVVAIFDVAINRPLVLLVKWITHANIVEKNLKKIQPPGNKFSWKVSALFYCDTIAFYMILSWIGVLLAVGSLLVSDLTILLKLVKDAYNQQPEAIKLLAYPLRNNPDMPREVVWAYCVALDLKVGARAQFTESDIQDSLNELRGNYPDIDGQAALNCLNGLNVIDADVISPALDCETALKTLMTEARRGNPYAQFQLGCLYHEGDARKGGYSPEVAKEDRNDAAKKAVATLYSLGGPIVPNRNNSEAARWWRKAAEQDYAKAQYELGCLLVRSWEDDVPKDYGQAAQWFRKAAEQDVWESRNAQYELGLLYEEGHGVPQDYGQAAQWFRKAAEGGRGDEEEEAMLHLGALYEQGQGVPRSKVAAYALYSCSGFSDSDERRGKLAEGMTVQEIEAGEALSSQMEEGNNPLKALDDYLAVPQDCGQAAQWWRKGAEQGNAYAQYNLGLLYEKGTGVPQDYGQAAQWYRKAVEQGVLYANNNLGALYEQGQGVPRSKVVAYALYSSGYSDSYERRRKLADSMTAQETEAGEALSSQMTSDFRPPPRPKPWAAEALSSQMTSDFRDYLEKKEGNLLKAMDDYLAVPQEGGQAVQWWHNKAAEQGNAYAQYNLGLLYEKGTGVEQDYRQAAQWFRKAMEQGGYYASHHLGALYERGQGVPRSKVVAYALYDSERREKLADSMTAQEIEAGKVLSHEIRGGGLLEASYYLAASQDHSQAAQWWRKGAEQGNAYAQYNLGLLYEKGDGIPQDYSQAAQWFRKAVEQGSYCAPYNLGVLYERGHGVPGNKVIAYALYDRSRYNSDSYERRRKLADSMTEQEIEAGEALSSQMEGGNNPLKALDDYLTVRPAF